MQSKRFLEALLFVVLCCSVSPSPLVHIALCSDDVRVYKVQGYTFYFWTDERDVIMISQTPPGASSGLIHRTQQHHVSNEEIAGSKPSTIPSRSGNPISEIPRNKASSDLKSALSKKYEGSYSLQKTLLTSGMEAYDYLISIPPNEITDGIMKRLLQRYYPHFSLIKTLFESEEKSYRELNQ